MSIHQLADQKLAIGVAIPFLFWEKSSVLLVQRKVVGAWKLEFEAKEDGFVFLAILLDCGVFEAVVVVANLTVAEVLAKIFVSHEENPVVGRIVVELLSKLIAPFGRVVGPVSLPFPGAPGIPELDNAFYCLSVLAHIKRQKFILSIHVLHFVGVQERVGVGAGYSDFLNVGVRPITQVI